MLNYRKSAYWTYLEYLFGKIGGGYYEDLLYELWNIDFEPRHRLDFNWAERGLGLRVVFYELTGGRKNVPGYGRKVGDEKPCSVLEMLVSLCLEAADSVGDGIRWSDARDWFHAILDNLGLDSATNSNFELYREFLWREMNAVMLGHYDKFGRPYNWFVLTDKGAKKVHDSESIDFPTMDIWHQLMCWIRANSDIENIFEREETELEVEV